MELVSFETLKSFLNLTDDNVTEYPRLAVIKANVESAIEGYLGRKLEKDTRTEYIDVIYRTNIIKLDAIPVLSVSYVGVKPFFENTFTEYSNYIINDFGLRFFNSIAGAQVKVTYTGGFEDDEIPTDISRAALLQTVYEFQNSPRVGIKSITTDGGTISTEGYVFLSEVERLLYKHLHPANYI